MKLISLLALVILCAFTAHAQNNQFNLTDFEAVGDGVTDDGPALQRALDAVAEAGGGTLFIPAGRYLIQTPVVRNFSGVSVHIQGVPSDKMPASPTAGGEQLATSLDLVSEFIPATGCERECHHAAERRQLNRRASCFHRQGNDCHRCLHHALFERHQSRHGSSQ